ncbi:MULTISPECIES: hypothetical protein [Bacillus]|uniref:Uncharacterized protein n=1 Tax=Bacillus pumilus TaxID=1408 RepID=A0AB34QTY9_BACPU|nr:MULTISPECIES: hypothetical protein [Bacillus]MCA1020044.1 hypothetical protein [Bacillus stratosphericus]KIL13596.1 hypothetical protein B4127_0608 [Bacillus pumilus]MBU8576255.1 hypothetical protein [Bacillus pumilus]MCY7571412.1 hypothetical protein [Bacillus pumilus]MDH6595452.1 hypothetical protein [Bacillus aerius]
MTGQNITEIGWGMVAAGVIVVMGVAVNGFFPDLIPEILNGMKSQLLGIFKK